MNIQALKAIGVAMKKQNISNKDFAKYLGVTESYLSRLVNCKEKPSEKLLDRICDKLNISDDFKNTIKYGSPNTNATLYIYGTTFEDK